MANFYEAVIILNSEIPDAEVEGSINKVKDVIQKGGGDVLKTDNWGKKKLAYELNKQRKGIYVLLLFKSPPSTILSLEQFFRVFDPVIKFIIIRLSKKELTAALPKEETEAVKAGG